jgi:hypothetical protein
MAHAKPTLNEFVLSGNVVTHTPTGATWVAYEGVRTPHSFKRGLLAKRWRTAMTIIRRKSPHSRTSCSPRGSNRAVLRRLSGALLAFRSGRHCLTP